MTHHRIALFTADDVAEAERDLAYLMAQHAEEEDPAWRDLLADMIASDARYLAEMQEAVRPRLRLVLPIGLPAPNRISSPLTATRRIAT